jgi:DeoR/GlpR family transcriptional regulator of sugar metabolism
VRNVEPYVNRLENVQLRSLFAQKLIELINEGKTLLDIDETPFPTSDNRNMAWIEKSTTNKIEYRRSYPGKTIFAGVSTSGLAIAQILQGNNNTETFISFMTDVIQFLDDFDSNWRENWIIVLDNHASVSFYNILTIF